MGSRQWAGCPGQQYRLTSIGFTVGGTRILGLPRGVCIRRWRWRRAVAKYLQLHVVDLPVITLVVAKGLVAETYTGVSLAGELTGQINGR